MKRLTIIITVLLAALTVQGQQFKKGTTAMNAGVGLGTALGGLGKARPALSLSLDYGMWDMNGLGVISLGAYVGNTAYIYNSGNYTSKWNYLITGIRGAYHYNGFTSAPKLDVYGGLMLGFNIVSYSSDGDDLDVADNYSSGMGLSGFLGSRWFFSEKLGAFAELGYGVSVLNVGITYKF